MLAGPQDFASAAMMRLVGLGLRQQRLAVPVSVPHGAFVPRVQKSDVLAGIMAAHGPRAILRIADAARSMSPEPVVLALSRARGLPDLMDRWHRLERFSHGRHTVAVDPGGGNALRLTHRARDDGPAPSVAESLLVFGVLAVLAEMTARVQVTLTTDAGEVWREGGLWLNPVAPMPGASVILTCAPADKAAPARRPPSAPASWQMDPLARMRRLVTSDPVRRWTLADVAAEAGTSPRTLQRRLGENAATFSRLVSEARVQVAASHLCQAKDRALAEIGFIAGFADHAHFTRIFGQFVGTTPSSFRADFSR